ncbi:MAG: flagellar basal body rod protein FlgB [Leptospiraceae bacterium]|nr:flagellar basal body rod protein FlgB [Leptospiraceae bacterium]
MSIFDSTITMRSLQVLEKGLDAAMLRREVLANNIANVDVPHFKRSEVVFESELKRALSDERALEAEQKSIQLHTSRPDHIAQRQSRHVSDTTPRVSIDYNSSMRNDGNNVDIEDEVARLVRNQMQYSMMVDRIGGTFRLLNQLSRLA